MAFFSQIVDEPIPPIARQHQQPAAVLDVEDPNEAPSQNAPTNDDNNSEFSSVFSGGGTYYAYGWGTRSEEADGSGTGWPTVADTTTIGSTKKRKMRYTQIEPVEPMFGDGSLDDATVNIFSNTTRQPQNSENTHPRNNIHDVEDWRADHLANNNPSHPREDEEERIPWSQTSSVTSSTFRPPIAESDSRNYPSSEFGSRREQRQIRWSESSSPSPPPRIVRPTGLNRPLPYNVGKLTNKGLKNKQSTMRGRFFDVEYSDTSEEEEEEEAGQNTSARNNNADRAATNGNESQHNANVGRENLVVAYDVFANAASNLPTPPRFNSALLSTPPPAPSSNSSSTLASNARNDGQRNRPPISAYQPPIGRSPPPASGARPGSSLSMRTAFSDSSTSSFTIISDPYIAQHVERGGSSGANRQQWTALNATNVTGNSQSNDHRRGDNGGQQNEAEAAEYDNDEDEMGLSSIDVDIALEELRSSRLSSSLSNGQAGAATFNVTNSLLNPTMGQSTTSTQTGSTLHHELAPLLFCPIVLSRERNQLRLMARQMGLQFQVRHDEGALVFSHPSSRRIIVLNSMGPSDHQNDGQHGAIRVSLHKDGSILRETRLPPVEKWLGLATFEGLCRQFFAQSPE